MSDIMLIKESQRAKVAPSNMEGLIPPDERKEGDANELCYISGFSPDRYLHCRSRRTVLHGLREKKIAAHYSH